MSRIILNAILITLWIGAMASACGTHRNEQVNSERAVFQKKPGTDWCSFNSGFYLSLPAGIDSMYSVCISKISTDIQKWVVQNKNQIQIKVSIEPNLARKGEDEFLIQIEKTKIHIRVHSKQSIPIALNWLKREIKANLGKIHLGFYTDYSLIKHRSLHLVMTGQDPVDRIKTWIDSASSYNFNTLILQLTPGISLQGFERSTLEQRWTKLQFQDVVDYARKSGFNVIPELTLLTKQNKLFADSHPEWLYNEQTYDPGNEDMYNHVYALIDELIEICEPTYFHIGHDELHGIKGKPETAHVRVLPQKLFIQDVQRIHKYLQKKGIRTMMWSDMLLNPDLFPEMRKVSLLGINGYENTADFIPKEVLICDWHYKDVLEKYPSTTWLNAQGFEVWGATWDNLETIDSFSAFVANSPLKGDKGMIATTWHRVLKNYSVETLIKHAGDAFWKS